MGDVKKSISRDSLAARIIKNVKRDRDHLSKWRSMAKESYAFYGNQQYSTDDASNARELQKALITLNQTTRTIAAVMGLEASNRQAVMYYPRQPGKSSISEMLTSAVDWARESCDAEDEEMQSFLDMLVCGIGWTETRIDREVDPEGMVVVERRDPINMGYDISSRKFNLDDAKHLWRIDRITKNEYNEMFPDAPKDIIPSKFNDDEQPQPHNQTEAKFYKGELMADYSSDDIDVIQYQWFEMRNYYHVVTLSGEEIYLPEEKIDVNEQFIKISKVRKRHFMQAFLTGGKIIEKHDLPVNMFTFRAMTGIYSQPMNIYIGLVELMKDPQRYLNKLYTEALYILRTNSSGGTMYEEGAFSNKSKALDDWVKPNSHIEIRPGKMDSVRPKVGMGGFTDGMMSLMQVAAQSVRDVTGVNMEMLGLSDRNQPAYLEQQRKESASGVLSPFFSSMRRYHKEQGRVIAEMVINYISDGRLIRVVGDAGAEYVPLLKTEMPLKYDVIVDEATTNPNIKERVFKILSPIIPMLMQAGIPVPPEVLDYIPIPDSLAMKWKEMITPKEPSPEEIQAQQEQEQRQKMMEDINMDAIQKMSQSESDYKMSQTTLNYAKAQTERVNAANKEADVYDKVSGADEMRKNEEFVREQNRKDAEAILEANREYYKQFS